MPKKQAESAEGVALSIPDTADRYDSGVPVARDASEQPSSEPKSGQKAATKESN